MNKNLIIGFGSEILADQSIVPDLIKSMKPAFCDEIDFSIELISNLDLITLFKDYDSLLILDTIQDENSELGKMEFFSIDDFKPGLHLENYHDTSITETLEVAKQLGFEMPKFIGIITVNVRDVYTLNQNFSKELKEKFPKILHQLQNIVIQHFKLETKPINHKLSTLP